MKIKERLDKWLFNRNLKYAKKRFEKVRKSSIYNEAPRLKRRGYVKAILQAAGFRRIRIDEKKGD